MEDCCKPSRAYRTQLRNVRRLRNDPTNVHEDPLAEWNRNGYTEVYLVGNDKLLIGYAFPDLVNLLEKHRVACMGEDMDVFLSLDKQCVWNLQSRGVAEELEDIDDDNVNSMEYCAAFAWWPEGESSAVEVFVYCVNPGEEPAEEFRKLSPLLANTSVTDKVGVRAAFVDKERLPHFVMAPATLRFFLDANEHHQVVNLGNAFLSEDDCQAVSSFRGQIHLWNCDLVDNGRSLFDAVANHNGPIGLALDHMSFDVGSLLRAISCTRTLKSFFLSQLTDGIPEFNFGQLMQAVAQNNSLTSFGIAECCPSIISMSDWFDKVKVHLRRHPTLESLFFRKHASEEEGNEQQRRQRTRMLVDLLKTNTVLDDIDISQELLDEPIYHQEIISRLVANSFRPFVKSLLHESDDRLRGGVFGRAICHEEVRSNPTLMFMLLSQFPDLLKLKKKKKKTQQRKK